MGWNSGNIVQEIFTVHTVEMKRKRKHEKEKIGRNREFHTLPGTDLSPTRPEEAPRRSRK